MPDDAPPAMPLWVKVAASLALLVALVFIGMHLAGGGMRHGG